MNIRNKTLQKFLFNLIFAIYNCVLGLITGSWWFVTVGAYYVIISVMRFAIILSFSENKKSGNFVMRFSGVMLFVLSVVLCGIVYMTLEQNVATRYHEIVMITIALYAFVKITLAIISFVRSGKTKNAFIKTLQSIAVADAVVSIYSLQRSMLVSFGDMAERDITVFNTLSGIGMCIIVVLIGVYLMNGGKLMAKSKIVKANEKIEKTVVGAYKKIENTVVGGYKKIEDKFVDAYLTRDGESVEEAKKRLKKSE